MTENQFYSVILKMSIGNLSFTATIGDGFLKSYPLELAHRTEKNTHFHPQYEFFFVTDEPLILECEGKEYSFADLQTLAEAEKPLVSFINPDDALFVSPGDMPGRVVQFCRESGQKAPENVGQIVRVIMESLALRYRYTLEGIEALRGSKVSAINIVGGGTKDTFLCQLAADACGVPVVAGPVEATAIGNLLAQLLAAREINTLAEARELVRASFEPKIYMPGKDRAAWDEAYARFTAIAK